MEEGTGRAWRSDQLLVDGSVDGHAEEAREAAGARRRQSRRGRRGLLRRALDGPHVGDATLQQKCGLVRHILEQNFDNEEIKTKPPISVGTSMSRKGGQTICTWYVRTLKPMSDLPM